MDIGWEKDFELIVETEDGGVAVLETMVRGIFYGYYIEPKSRYGEEYSTTDAKVITTGLKHWQSLSKTRKRRLREQKRKFFT